MGFSRPTKQVDNFQTKVDSCTWPLARSAILPRASQTTRLSCHCSAGILSFSVGKPVILAIGEDIIAGPARWLARRKWRDDTPERWSCLTVSSQQGAIAKTLCAFDARQAAQSRHIRHRATSTSGASASSFTPRGNRQVTIAGDAGDRRL